MEILIIIVILGVLALFIAGVIHYHRKEKERRESLQALATELGWTFSPHYDRSHDDLYAHFELFRRGHGRAAYNTLSGPLEIKGRPYSAKMGDFTYKVTSGTGKNRRTTTYHFSYLIVHLPFGQVPALIIRREGLFDRVAGFFGYGSISFESAEFNRRFYVNGDDKKFAYDVLHPRMMEFLMQTEPPTIDIEHGRMCLSDGRQRWSPEEFRRQIEWMQRFFENWPKHVKADLEAGVPNPG
ncbi:MAG: hypothetical protein EA377_01360 [Phycisphaerales bacterium]|nr:MAG: hypothetical protein EA377_01360 [Phycisphaerales bacterium]